MISTLKFALLKIEFCYFYVSSGPHKMQSGMNLVSSQIYPRLTLISPQPELPGMSNILAYYAFENPSNLSAYYDVKNFGSAHDADILNHGAISAERYIIGGGIQKIRVVTMDVVVESLKAWSERKSLLKKLLPLDAELSMSIQQFHDNITKQKESGKLVVKYVGDIETDFGIYDTFSNANGEIYHLMKDILPIFKNIMGIKGTEYRVIIDGTFVDDGLISAQEISQFISKLNSSSPIVKNAIDQIKKLASHYENFDIIPSGMPKLEDIKTNIIDEEPKSEKSLRKLVNDWILTNPAGDTKACDYHIKFFIDCALTLKARGVGEKVIFSGKAFNFDCHCDTVDEQLLMI